MMKLGIELTTRQKIQIAVILLALGVATFFILRQSRPAYESTVNSWTFSRSYNSTGGRPTAASPADPKRRENVTGFGCADGKLEIIEYPNDPTKHPRLVFLPETRISTHAYKYYRDPMVGIERYKDPFEKALALATYHSMFKSSLGLLGRVGMNEEQLRKELELRTALKDEFAIIDDAVKNGMYRVEMMEAVMNSLAAFNAKSGTTLDNPQKADLAHQVIKAATDYLKQVLADKDKSIDAYMDGMDGVLTSEQKTKLVEASQAYLSPPARPQQPTGRRGGLTTGGITAPPRGAGTATPTTPRGAGTASPTTPRGAGRAAPATQRATTRPTRAVATDARGAARGGTTAGRAGRGATTAPAGN